MDVNQLRGRGSNIMDLFKNRLVSLCGPALTYQTKRFNSKYKLMHYYNTLKVRPNSSPEEIRENFIELVKIYHPDNPDTGNEAKFIRIKTSYEKIKEAPLWQEGDVGEDILTHADFVRSKRIDETEHRRAVKYSYRKYLYKLYKKG